MQRSFTFHWLRRRSSCLSARGFGCRAALALVLCWVFLVGNAAVYGGSGPPALVLSDGGIRFPDGTVQVTAVMGVTPAPRTGQSTVRNAGDDGDLQRGVIWPNPRFTVNGDGTVTDNLTGLVWLREADCLSSNNWTSSFDDVPALHDGCADCGGTNGDCGLADGSVAGEWRVPNVRELQSLVHYGQVGPALPDTSGAGHWAEEDPFVGVESFGYWTSTSDTGGGSAWVVEFDTGDVVRQQTIGLRSLWPVRGGQ